MVIGTHGRHRDMVRHRTVEVAGIRIFYREAGSQDAPAVLLLHGFPSSSHQFRFLLLALADRYHVLAPDFPGFGFSACPNTAEYAYIFTHYADTIEAFTRKFELDRYALYVHDYEAQVGFRLALRSPDRIKALVIQNSEALRMAALRPSQQWRTSGVILRLKSEKYCDENSLQKEGIRSEFVEQLSPETVELIDPGTISLAWSQISRPGVIDALLDLHLDYRTNVALYSKFHSYFRQYNPPTLIIWGRQDQYCTPAAATAYTRDLPDAEICIIEGGHWAVESHGPHVIQLTREFLDRHCYSPTANLSAA